MNAHHNTPAGHRRWSGNVVALFAAICLFISFNRDSCHHNQYTFDKGGYYFYLPAIFIYHDLQNLSFYPQVDSLTGHSMGLSTSLHPVNGHVLNKYPAGIAIMQSPFFAAAHLYCLATSSYPANGFSVPYQLSVILATIFWATMGIELLRRLLLQYFNDNVVGIALICIAFGTNLYAYTAFDAGMSHPFSFMLFAAVIYVSRNIFYNGKNGIRQFLLLGALAGLIFLVRPANLLVMTLPAMMAMTAMLRTPNDIRALIRVAAVCLALLLVASVQLFYWKYITGHWLFYPYIGEHFNFASPHIINGLFSYRKGWLLYTPMAIPCLAGTWYLFKNDRVMSISIIAFIILAVYVTFSWSQWWYGGSFGCRPLVEAFAILSLPLAALINAFSRSAARWQRGCLYTVLAIIIALNMLQTYQYSTGIIHWDRMTKDAYWNVFGRVNVDKAAADKLLLP